MFYVFPLTAGPTDAMGMVFLIIVATFVLAIIMGSVSKKKAKYVYPLLVSVLFIPSVFIYYNDSALIHSIWYLVISSVGLLIGALMQYFFSRKWNKSQFWFDLIHNILINCYILSSWSPQPLENAKFVASEFALMLSLVLYPFPSCYECSQGQNQGKENPVTNYNMKWKWQ
mgnify:CR=1 FL=1